MSNYVEELALLESNRCDKSYIPTSLWNNYGRLRIQRKAYLEGKSVGFHLGVEAYKPYTIMRELGKSCKDAIENRFFCLLDLFYKRFGIGITYHPREGMIFVRIAPPNKEQEDLFYEYKNEDIITITKEELIQELHLKIEQFTNEELSSISFYINSLQNGKS